MVKKKKNNVTSQEYNFNITSHENYGIFFALLLNLPVIMTAFGQLYFYNFKSCCSSSRKVILDQAFRLLIFLKDKLNIDILQEPPFMERNTGNTLF